MSAGRAHIDFHNRKVTGLSDTLVVLRDIDELKVDEAPVRAESLSGLPSEFPQLLRNLRNCVELDLITQSASRIAS